MRSPPRAMGPMMIEVADEAVRQAEGRLGSDDPFLREVMQAAGRMVARYAGPFDPARAEVDEVVATAAALAPPRLVDPPAEAIVQLSQGAICHLGALDLEGATRGGKTIYLSVPEPDAGAGWEAHLERAGDRRLILRLTAGGGGRDPRRARLFAPDPEHARWLGAAQWRSAAGDTARLAWPLERGPRPPRLEAEPTRLVQDDHVPSAFHARLFDVEIPPNVDPGEGVSFELVGRTAPPAGIELLTNCARALTVKRVVERATSPRGADATHVPLRSDAPLWAIRQVVDAEGYSYFPESDLLEPAPSWRRLPDGSLRLQRGGAGAGGGRVSVTAEYLAPPPEGAPPAPGTALTSASSSKDRAAGELARLVTPPAPVPTEPGAGRRWLLAALRGGARCTTAADFERAVQRDAALAGAVTDVSTDTRLRAVPGGLVLRCDVLAVVRPGAGIQGARRSAVVERLRRELGARAPAGVTVAVAILDEEVGGV